MQARKPLKRTLRKAISVYLSGQFRVDIDILAAPKAHKSDYPPCDHKASRITPLTWWNQSIVPSSHLFDPIVLSLSCDVVVVWYDSLPCRTH